MFQGSFRLSLGMLFKKELGKMQIGVNVRLCCHIARLPRSTVAFEKNKNTL